MYRNNTSYETFLAPAIAGREEFETQVFPLGTDPEEITAWIAENATRIRNMEKIYLDQTCYDAGEKVPSPKGLIWWDVSTNYGDFDFDFREAAFRVIKKETVEETIAEILRHMLAVEMPDNVLLVEDKMSDHNPFGPLDRTLSKEDNDRRDAKKFAECLERVIGKPVHRVSLRECESRWGQEVVLDGPDPIKDGKSWYFHDRHYSDCRCKWIKEDVVGGEVSEFTLPIENLVRDATRFGITFDTDAYSRAIRDIVATW